MPPGQSPRRLRRLTPTQGDQTEAVNAKPGSKPVVPICTGAFALAEAGLLAGRRATTHWHDAARLAREHPDIEVDSAGSPVSAWKRRMNERSLYPA